MGRWAAAMLLLLAVPAGTAVAAECPPGTGTTVVVDFAALGGGVEVGCAPTATTGFAALAEAGFAVETTQQNAAFVCRIDARPGPDDEDCVDIPPDSAFWSYWSADAGGEWRFNVAGASAALAGDVEGWAFATGRATPPRYAVPAPVPTTTTTTTTTTTIPPTTTTPTPSVTAPSTTLPPPTTVPSTTGATPSTTRATPTTLPATTRATPTTISTTTFASAAQVPGEDARGGAGGFMAGSAVVAGIAAASWVIARKRAGGT